MTPQQMKPFALIAGGLFIMTLFDPPDQVRPLEKPTIERFLHAMGSERATDFAVVFHHIKPDGSKTDIIAAYRFDGGTRQWFVRMETRLYGEKYLPWEKALADKKGSYGNPTLAVYYSFLPPDTLKNFAREIINSGLFEIPLQKETYETVRVEHPAQKGRWYVGMDWYWSDPKGLLCGTESCRKANKAQWLDPTSEELARGLEFVSIRMGSGPFDMRWTTDRMETEAPFAPLFKKVIHYVYAELVPFAEKNYYDKRLYEGKVTTYVPTMGTPQRNLCFLYSPQVCGLPSGPAHLQSSTSG